MFVLRWMFDETQSGLWDLYPWKASTYHGAQVTLQHAVVGLPIPPSHRLPESRGFRPLVALVNGHFAAAVQPRLQGAPVRTEITSCGYR